MSSVSSFICLSSNISNTSQSEQSDFSFIQNPSHKPLQFDASAIHINENKNEIDDFEHLSQNEPIIITSQNIDNNNLQDTEPHIDNEHDEWSSINDHNFDIQSLNTTTSIQSIDTVKHFIFGDYKFNKTGEKCNNSSSKWVWTGSRRKLKHRRKKNRLESSLCMIDENGEMEPESINTKTVTETAENKTVINVRDLNHFINDTIQINDNITNIINLCNKICKTGMLNINNMDIELHQIPLIGLKLRDIFFRKLVLLNEKKCDDMVDNINDKYMFRREYWLRLSWYSRVYLTPFGSFEEFRDLYNVDKSVSSMEFFSVIDKESFDILMKPEWIRICLFSEYVMKIKNMNMINRMEIEREKMEEIRTLCNIGNFNDEMINIQRFRHKQLSFIMSDCYSRYDTEFDDSFQAFDALERDMKMKLRLECEQMDTFTNSTCRS
eukprot:283093_1